MVNGVHSMLRGLQSELAGLARTIGSVAALATIGVDALALIGADLTSFELPIFVAINALNALWYLLAGLTLARGDRALRTLGWNGQLGALGAALTTVLIAIGFQTTGVGVQSWFIYAAVLSLFALVFLVRLWQYASLGKLPDARFL